MASLKSLDTDTRAQQQCLQQGEDTHKHVVGPNEYGSGFRRLSRSQVYGRLAHLSTIVVGHPTTIENGANRGQWEVHRRIAKELYYQPKDEVARVAALT
jgi:hypothetical protein